MVLSGHSLSPTWCSSSASCMSVHRTTQPVVEGEAMPSHYDRHKEGAVVAMRPTLDDEGWLLL